MGSAFHRRSSRRFSRSSTVFRADLFTTSEEAGSGLPWYVTSWMPIKARSLFIVESVKEARSGFLSPSAHNGYLKQIEAPMPKILVVEDEPDMLRGLRDNFEFEHYEVDVARDGETALKKISGTSYDLV